MPETSNFQDRNLIESTYIINVLITEFNVLTQQAIFCYVSLKTQTMSQRDLPGLRATLFGKSSYN